jgi:hypothetical protein
LNPRLNIAGTMSERDSSGGGFSTWIPRYPCWPPHGLNPPMRTWSVTSASLQAAVLSSNNSPGVITFSGTERFSAGVKGTTDENMDEAMESELSVPWEKSISSSSGSSRQKAELSRLFWASSISSSSLDEFKSVFRALYNHRLS